MNERILQAELHAIRCTVASVGDLVRRESEATRCALEPLQVQADSNTSAIRVLRADVDALKRRRYWLVTVLLALGVGCGWLLGYRMAERAASIEIGRGIQCRLDTTP